MPLLNKLKQLLNFFSAKETEPAKAYNLWSESYDDQPDNLMLALDEAVLCSLINTITFKDKIVADIGCGTGRHWKKILDKQPSAIIGYDVSQAMLNKLLQKFPQAQTHLIKHGMLEQLPDNSVHLLISTLTLAHIKNIEQAFTEWHRVVKPGGDIVITDYHPATLAKGGNRTFEHKGKLIAIKNYVHPLEEVRIIAKKLRLKEELFIEKTIDETMKHYYEKLNALPVFEKFKGTPIIYGIHLKKSNDII